MLQRAWPTTSRLSTPRSPLSPSSSSSSLPPGVLVPGSSLARSSSPHPIPWCRSVHRLQLAVEHHHRCHHSLHGRRGTRQLEVFRLLRLGRSLYGCLGLHLLPRSRDKGSDPRTSRQDVRREHPRTSAKWKPSKTFASTLARDGILEKEIIEATGRRGSAF